MARWLVLLVLVASATLGADDGCTAADSAFGLCSIDANLNDDSATLGGTSTSPGGSDPTYDGDGSTPTQPAENCEYFLQMRCAGDPPPRATQVFVLTLADIASFRPTPAVHSMEPVGWGVIGLPSNFYASGGTQVVAGTLLGRPAFVRFTPVAWHWDYGDGTTATRGTGGASWASLGIPEFDVTPTSHIYRAAGTYTVRLSVEYTAEYRVGDMAWRSIAGTLGVASNPLRVAAGAANTVLVGRDCEVNPGGPGC